jgi:hypothetical protein
MINRKDVRQISNGPRRHLGHPGDEPNLRLNYRPMHDGFQHIGLCSFYTTIELSTYLSRGKWGSGFCSKTAAFPYVTSGLRSRSGIS